MQAVEDCLGTIQRLQPRLKAFVTVCADEARAQAREIDRRRAAGEKLGPLAGVPVSVKDILNTKGVRTAWGSRLMEHNVPAADHVAVARLKDAGAVILGKTTTPEFAYKLLTDSPISGITRNPWNAELTAGGSSGGSAAAVAAGMGPLSLATDAGASTRLPAACCGILGLKPTLGRVPHDQVPDAFNSFIHLGLMARTVEDCELMLQAVAGPHPSDPYSFLSFEQKQSKNPRIEWRPLLGNTLLDDEVREQCEAALAVLREAGAEVREVDEPFENAEAPWRVLQQSNWAARFYAKLAEVEPKIEPGFAEGIRAGGGYTGQQLLAATVKRTELFRKVQAWFARCDLVATPTLSRPALSATHRVDEPITVNGKPAGDMRVAWAPYLNVFNLTGHPALSVPAGFTRAGLPVGLQLVARWHAEADLFAAARLIEKARPWATRFPPEAA
ncbi:MAG TPA: amidase family protein [Ramlibacter sp.]|uniref:amidase n=1 Tax=Ramlibacter sp. TaxID=1917967 RepID=UPI002D8045AF|nr:amidase family protein [Ramlibacter sp.]HET8746806.1 amidase family protein [Ramlibacter sp.]